MTPTNPATIEYETSIGTDFFTGVDATNKIFDAGINFGLDFSSPEEGVLVIKGRENNYGSATQTENQYNGKTINYHISYDDALKLFNWAGISTGSGYRMYWVDKKSVDGVNYVTGEHTITKKDKINDLNFEMTDEYFTGLYITAYDKNTMDEYFNNVDLTDKIKDQIKNMFGITGDSDLLDKLAAEVEALITGNYVTSGDINDYITKYFFGETADPGTMEDRLKKLAELILDNADNQNKILDLINNSFDIQNLADKDAIYNYIIDKIARDAEAAIEALIGDITPGVGFTYDIQYLIYAINKLIEDNLSTWVNTDLAELQKLIDDVKNIPGIDTLGLSAIISYLELMSKPEILQMIKDEINNALGLTGATTDPNISEFVNNAVKNIIEQYSKDLVTAEDLQKTVSQYLSDHINELIEAYLNVDKNKNTILSAVYDAFTDNIDKDTANQLASYLLDQIVSIASATAQTSPGRFDQIQNMLDLYLKGWSNELIDKLEDRVSDLENEVGNNSEDINSLKNRLDRILDMIYSGGFTGRDGQDGKDGQSFTEWANQNYGSVDGFINYLLRRMQQQGGYNNQGGTAGASAYDIAVRNGFRGTERQWLESLEGASAYDIAVQNGFRGTEKQWLESLRGQDGKDGRDGADGRDGRDGKDGKDGQIIYMDGYSPNSSKTSIDSDDPDDEEITILDGSGNSGNYSGIIDKSANGDGRAANPNARSANPATGAGAFIVIPAAAVGAVLLLKKDKRKRGRRK
ncbi:MAG: hypothetical protein K5876_04635 [Ruminiclostridium sp.]|nr:hypothetical protein [Ruminiclostridium sp.]